MTYPGLPAANRAAYEQQRQTATSSFAPDIIAESRSSKEEISKEAESLRQQITAITNQESEQALRSSFAGRIGIALEPISRLAGFDWRTNIALVGGVAAKEVIISTLGTAYSMGKVKKEASDSLGQRLTHDPNWNKVVAVAALIFIMFYSPCFITVVCIAKEAGHWGWALFSISFNTAFAFLLATAVYQVGTWLG